MITADEAKRLTREAITNSNRLMSQIDIGVRMATTQGSNRFSLGLMLNGIGRKIGLYERRELRKDLASLGYRVIGDMKGDDWTSVFIEW